MIAIIVLAVTAFIVTVVAKGLHRKTFIAKLLGSTLSVTTLAALSLVPSASAAAPQAPLFITNSVTTASVTSSFTLATSGGSGTGAVTFKATGTGCVVKTNKLTATQPTSCSVVATKAAAGAFAAANSAAVTFTFTGVNQAKLSISNSKTTSVVGKSITVTTSGGSGRGLVSFAVSGTSCSMKAAVLSATAMTTCSVTATKAANGTYNAVSSTAVVFTFNPKTFSIVNSVKAGTVGVPLTVIAVGGTATGTPYYSVTGTGCSINSSTGVLSASAAATCVVTAVLKSGSKTVATAPTASFGFTVENPTVAHPDVATLVSVTGAVGAQLNNTAQGQRDFINQYFNNSDHWYANYITAGSTITMKWHVNGSNGLPLGNAPVTLHGNLAYSCAIGVNWTTTSLNVYPGCGGSAEGLLTGTTDSNGDVSFTLVNNNNVAGSNPTNMTAASAISGNESSTFPWTDMLLQVKNLTYTGDPHTNINQATDRVDFIVIPGVGSKANNPTVAHPDVASLTGVTGVTGSQIDNTVNGRAWFINQYFNNGDHWYGYYIAPGATVTLTWHVDGSDGKPLANAPVTLHGNLDYSNASGVTWSQDTLNVYPGGGNGPEGVLTGTTNALGNVTFTLNNTNTDSGTQPTDTTSTDGMVSNEGPFSWTNMLLQVGNDVYTGDPARTITQGTDRVDFIVIPTAPSTPPTTPSHANPDIATLTNITGAVNSPIDFTSNGLQWFLNAYYSSHDHWNFTYVTAGSTINVTWHVVDFNGNAMKNQTVTLLTRFAGGDTNWTATGMDADGNVTGTTDANGDVTFALTNTDTSAAAAPSSLTDGWAALGAHDTNPWSRMALVIGTLVATNGDTGARGSATDIITADGAHVSLVNQATDLPDFIVVAAPDAPAPTGPTAANRDIAAMTGTSGAVNATPLDCTNTDGCSGLDWFISSYYANTDHWNFTYVTAGSSFTVTWHVTSYTGSAAANTTVTLKTQFAGTSANFSVAEMDANGNVTGTTDANGDITFTITVNDTSGVTPTNTADRWEALGYVNGSSPWTRMVLVVGSDTVTGASPSAVNQGTDLTDFIVVNA